MCPRSHEYEETLPWSLASLIPLYVIIAQVCPLSLLCRLLRSTIVISRQCERAGPQKRPVAYHLVHTPWSAAYFFTACFSFLELPSCACSRYLHLTRMPLNKPQLVLGMLVFEKPTPHSVSCQCSASLRVGTFLHDEHGSMSWLHVQMSTRCPLLTI